jgi:transposase
MWTAAARVIYRTDTRFYPSSMNNDEWKVVEPFFPADMSAPIVDGLKQGRDMRWTMRSIVDGIFYVLRNGVEWRSMPEGFPPWQTVYRWFRRFSRDGLFEQINHALVMLQRESAGREASPAGAVIDSQTVKATASPAPRGYDGGGAFSS